MLKTMFAIVIQIILLNVMPCMGEEMKLTITNFRLDSNNLQFEFYLKNNAKSGIWVCEDMDDKSKINYEVKIDENRKAIKIRFASFQVPKNLLLEEPIWARFRNIPPQMTSKGEVKLKVPVSDVNPVNVDPLKHKDLFKGTKLAYATTLILEIGIYKTNLEKHKMSCCRDDSDSQNAFVNVFWAAKNREQVIKKEIQNLKIPITIIMY